MRLSRLLVPALAAFAACSDPIGRADAQTGSLPDDANRQVPASAGQMQLSFAPVVRRAAPAVVNVLTARRRPRDPFYQQYGGGPQQPARVAPTGSGVIVRPDGYIITNNHVIEGASEIRVGLSDRRELPARVLLADPRVDLAVLKVDVGNERLPSIDLDAGGQPQIGDLVLALGNPFGVGQTVTSGIVSATERTGSGPLSAEGITDIASFIQTDAAINPGNSGGALVDMDGELIGINTAILSRSGTSSGVGFAVPAALVRQVLNTAAGGGRRVVRPYLGVGTDAITTDIARSLGLQRPQGLLVRTITPGSPAARAGLREDDIILEINDVPVNERESLTFQIASRNPGDTVPIEIRRAGRAETLRVRLEATPELPREQRTLNGAHPLSGATVANLSGEILDQARTSALNAREGVLVVDPGTGYAGRRAGFRQLDLVTEVNGRPVRTVQELQSALAGPGGWRITVLRGGREIVGAFEA